MVIKPASTSHVNEGCSMGPCCFCALSIHKTRDVATFLMKADAQCCCNGKARQSSTAWVGFKSQLMIQAPNRERKLTVKADSFLTVQGLRKAVIPLL